MTSVQLIISGGQSGADLAGNEFAKEMGIATRCYAFEGFITHNKDDERILKTFERINIKVTRHGDYVQSLRDRTVHNVKRADATVIFLGRPLKDTRGSRLTASMCKVLAKPFALAYIGDWEDAVKQVADLVSKHKPTVLNVAGERNLDRKVVKSLLKDAWKKVTR